MINSILGLDLAFSRSGVAILGRGVETHLVKVKRGKFRQGLQYQSDRERLFEIGKQFDVIFAGISAPDLIVIEQPFTSKDVWACYQIRRAHGVVTACLGRAGFDCPILHVHAKTLKGLVTGDGHAEKKDMQAAIEKATGHHYSDDEADAVALAIVGRAVGGFDVNCPKCWGRGQRTKGDKVTECTACEGSGKGIADEVNLADLLSPYEKVTRKVDGVPVDTWARPKKPSNVKLHELILNEFGMSVEGLKRANKDKTNAKAKEKRAVLKMKRTKDVKE